MCDGTRCFYAQTRAEEICHESGARVARRVVEKDIPLLDCMEHHPFRLSFCIKQLVWTYIEITVLSGIA